MARPKRRVVESETGAEVAPLNIKNLDEILDAWEKSKLQPQTHIVFRTKLLELYKSGKAHPAEVAALWDVLKRERVKGTLSDANGDVLHAHESSECEDICRVKINNAPHVHRLVEGATMKYFYDANTDRYHVYPVRIIRPEEQLDLQTAKRIAAGITVDPATFPPEKLVIKKLVINAKEFAAWLEPVTDEINLPVESAETIIQL